MSSKIVKDRQQYGKELLKQLDQAAEEGDINDK